MGLNWNLKPLYESFECDSFKNDMNKLSVVVEELVKWAENINASESTIEEKLISYINQLEGIQSVGDRLGSFTELTLAVDSKNIVASKAKEAIDKKTSVLGQVDAIMSSFIKNEENLMELVQNSEKLKPYSFFISEIIKQSSHVLSEKEEVLIARMKQTGSTSWLDYKNLIVSTHKVTVEIDGEEKEMPLTMALNLAYDQSKEVRKKAYDAEIESYKKIEEGIAAALNAIKGQVLTISEMRGYESPLHMTLEDSRMTKATLDAMLDAIKEYLPVFRKYLRAKAEMLGYKNGLPFYEMYAPVVNQEMKFDFESGKEFVIKNFGEFSDHLRDFAKTAFDNEWIDVMPKEGKTGGAFCCNLKSLEESRILLNYGDNFSDVITLAHELGHGFHGECLKGQSSLNSNYPMPLAETASILCETIVNKAAIKEASEEQAFAILETEIGDATQVIVDIYSRYLFETELFEKRKDGFVSVEELKEMMLRAQRDAYGDGLDDEYLHPYMWTWKPHYYYDEANFYNFPYAFGLLFAKGLYAKYLEDRENFPKAYEKLLAVTGKMSIEDVTKIMNINVSDIEFWRGSLHIVEEDIKKFLEIAEKK